MTKRTRAMRLRRGVTIIEVLLGFAILGAAFGCLMQQASRARKTLADAAVLLHLVQQVNARAGESAPAGEPEPAHPNLVRRTFRASRDMNELLELQIELEPWAGLAPQRTRSTVTRGGRR